MKILCNAILTPNGSLTFGWILKCSFMLSWAWVLWSPWLQAELAVKPTPPTIQATSYLLMDAKSEAILLEHQSERPLPPASLTKMMTGYLMVQDMATGKLDEHEQIPVSVNAWRIKGSKMFIREGTKVKALDLLKGVIVQSGNDASIALAEHLAGSEQAFAGLMNQYAEYFGMTNTHFKNATGWPEEGHVSSAKDLAILAKHIIYDHPQYYKLYAERSFTYNNIKQPNRNQLLMRDPAVDGLKTGHTEEAGYCLVASAKKESMRLISVVMGADSSRSRSQESLKLLNYGFRFFTSHKLYDGNQALEQVKVWKGITEKLDLGLAEDLYLSVQKGQEKGLVGELLYSPTLAAPIHRGQKVGVLKVKLDQQVIVERPLIALAEIKSAGFFARLWDSIFLFFNGLFA